MKKFQAFAALTIIVLFPSLLPAQFLKNVLNSVKQTSQNNANDKANQAVNKALNRADSALFSKSNVGNSPGTPADTASTNKVLRAFAKAAADNPNDTSAADVTMKALGLLVGGGGVSKEDSVAAIKSFMTSTGGSGMFYQYITTTSTSKKNTTNTDTTSEYLSLNGNGRSEMRINMPGVITAKMITIAHISQPKYSMMLYPDSKTFSLNIIDTSLINAGSGLSSYQVTKIGTETVQGYQCIHSKLISTSGRGAFKSTSTTDVWTSSDVKGYAGFKKLTSVRNVQPQMMEALDKAGCGGMFVKMSVQGKDYSFDMVLVKAEEKNFPASLFEVPPGYQESKQNMMAHMLSGAKY